MHATPRARFGRLTHVLISAFAILALTVAVSACGSNSNSGSSSAGTKIGSGAITKGKKGGTLTFLGASDVDYIDPGQTYYQTGYQFLYATQRPLFSYKADSATVATPDLASGPAEVSADNKTITVHIRKGIHYSPPLANRVVTSADVKYAFERAFTQQVPSGYAATYFGSLVGAPKPANSGPYKPISGIVTPDPQTIVFHFAKPYAGFLVGALALPLSTPVPKEYAMPFDKHNPSTYDQHVVFTGPYMVQNNASGKLIGHKPGKQLTLVRNPSWDASTDYRPAYLDKIVFQEGFTDELISSRKTLSGSGYLCCDSSSPPAQILRLASTTLPKQIQKVASGGGHWIALNTTIKPLDNVNIRRAMVAITDRNAIRKVSGGPIIGPISTGIIPPAFPGFEEAGGLKQGGGEDFLANDSGNAAIAKKYMLAAKADGEPVSAAGKYTGGGKLLLIPANTPDQLKMALIIEAGFQKLGLNVKVRQVPQDAVYTKFCGVPKAKVPICSSVGWVKDFQDPETMFDATFDGRNILAQGNTNWSQLNDPAVNAAMDKARLLPAGKARLQAWADINTQIMKLAPIIPLFWDDDIQVTSKNVHSVESVFIGSPDFSYSWVDGP